MTKNSNPETLSPEITYSPDITPTESWLVMLPENTEKSQEPGDTRPSFKIEIPSELGSVHALWHIYTEWEGRAVDMGPPMEFKDWLISFGGQVFEEAHERMPLRVAILK